MASGKNKQWPIAAIILAIQIIAVVTLTPNSWMTEVQARERSLLVSGLGRPAAEWVSKKGYEWYITAFYNSGVVKETYDLFIPDRTRRPAEKGFENFGKPWFQYVEGRLKAFWTTVALMTCRLAMATLWLPYLTVLAVPAVLDGMMMWRAKREGFEFSSPVVHRYSLRACYLLAWLSVISLTVPVPLHPLLFPALLFSATFALGFVASTMPRRI